MGRLARQLIFPYARGRDGEIKRQFVRAALAAVDAVREADPHARFLFPEPLIHNVPPRWFPWIKKPAQGQRASQFEAWDMIAGRAAPELGGEHYLDIVGVNLTLPTSEFAFIRASFPSVVVRIVWRWPAAASW